MENVVCSCIKCGSEFGSFRNSWIGIGNSYFSPVYSPTSYINGFKATGDVFAKGPDGSAVQNSVLQDLACKKCSTVVGLRCDDAPDGHLLKKNQLIIRLAEMNVVSEQTGDKAIISVLQKIPLMAPGVKRPPAVKRAITAQPTSRAQTSDTLVEYGKQNSTNGNMLPPPAEDSSRKNLARFPAWVEDAINSQQKDIDRIGGAVARIEREIKSFKEFMVEVRAELAATRATRKTQEDLKNEQLAWLQEDMKELRQEQGDFQQDMREEELPSIHNELEQLRQELDSNDRFTEVPDLGQSPIDRIKGLAETVKRIDHKFNEVNGLKMELQRLQKRLADIEGKRQDSFIFPRTHMDNSGPNEQMSQGESRIRSASAKARQQPRLMSEAPGNATARSMAARNVSPTPPGAFPDSVMDLDTPRQNVTGLPVESGVIPSEPTRQTRADEPEVAETTSPKRVVVQKWSYTGPRRWKGAKSAFQTFGLEYPKLGSVSESIKVLEDHVNNLNIQNSRHAKKHGRVDIVEEILVEELLEVQGGCMDELDSSIPKRKHDQVEGATEQSPSETAKKRRKRSSIPAANSQSTVPDQVLRSSSPRSQTPERRAAIGISNHESHELGSESRLIPDPEGNNAEPALESEPTTLPILEKRRFPRRLRNPSLGGDRSTNGPPTSSPMQSLKTGERTKATKAAKRTRSAAAYVAESIPGSETSNFDTSRPFGCGACGKQYKNLEGLTYHKEHTTCNDHEDDVAPKDFRCPTCNESVSTQEGMRYHILHSPTCKDAQDEQTKGIHVAWHTRKKKSFKQQERTVLMKPGNNDAELTPVAVPGVDAILPTIEVDDAPIPGSFPSDIETPASKATHLQANSDLQGIDTNPSKPYKCGSCGKTYKNAGGLKYHKEHSSCTVDPNDVIPADFQCPSCNKRLTQEGMRYHLAVSVLCNDKKDQKGKKKVAPSGYDFEQQAREEQKREEVLAARERLVKEMLDRE